MHTNKRNRLVELGTECLADALLELANRHEDVENMVERLTATPKENVKRFKAKLSGLKRRRRFLYRSQSFAFAEELRGILKDLQAGISDPQTGTELVAAFYEADDAIFRQCDDSYGNIGDIFRIDAKNLFVSYASQCENKEGLIDLVLKLNRDDGYGIRDALFHCASDYLPESAIHSMVGQLWDLAQQGEDEYRTRHWILGIESLARQLKDPHLFEKARLVLWPELSTAACIDIAQVYLEAEDAQTALSWLEKIPEGAGFKTQERDELLLTIYKTLGNQEQLQEVAWRVFRRYRSKNTLATLLDALDEDQPNSVIDEESQLILQSDFLSYSDAQFLMEVDRLDDAETDTVSGEVYEKQWLSSWQMDEDLP